jgi:hypothetical protein
MLKNRIIILANLFSLVAVIYVNYLATALPIAGRTPASVSDMFPTLFTPAGFTFAIWGIIYLLLISYAVYQLSFWQTANPLYVQKVGYWFILSCFGNAGWLFAFHHLQIGWSMVLMLILLGSLLKIYLRLDIGRSPAKTAERWFGHLPFSVYMGWITVATIANTCILFTHLGWDGQPGGPVFWTLTVIVAAVAVALWLLFSRRDIAFAGVIIWALYGIFSKRMADQNAQDGLIETGAQAGMILLGIAILIVLVRTLKPSAT